MTDASQTPPAAARARETVTITLNEPITRGGGNISEITLRKPRTGEMRGLKVEDMFTTDVNTLIVLLPRIATPTLIAADVENLDADDLMEVAGAVKGFFMPPAMKQAIKALSGA
ncbi:phage tail assembly protein [Novosphingobium mangrovi (ex Hu et al. 2023)]|uniref:Phage tail assembly protein n=1 Tax=Novosphingobium mangrovi (ex Hu et al. 2023) TaxID=2930094 RepID=A0ABT0A8V4_9SPHN|nr:phage tail assembly protein [Novosphingobium mangrovi (ex Hu et al. 2023)]MCJ1959635.1 phage tail assembly protein [Novosphingobium mangrovi (ex Hu et al. 2023)]